MGSNQWLKRSTRRAPSKRVILPWSSNLSRRVSFRLVFGITGQGRLGMKVWYGMGIHVLRELCLPKVNVEGDKGGRHLETIERKRCKCQRVQGKIRRIQGDFERCRSGVGVVLLTTKDDRRYNQESFFQSNNSLFLTTPLIKRCEEIVK